MKDKIKELRKRYKLSQTDFAEICNVTRQTVAKWERGITMPKTDALACICRHFGVDMNYMMSDAEPLGLSCGVGLYPAGTDPFAEESAVASDAQAPSATSKEPSERSYTVPILSRIDCTVVLLTHIFLTLLFAALTVAFISALISTVIAGASAFSTNLGNVRANNYNYDVGHFYIFLVLAVLSLVATALLAVLTRRWRKSLAAHRIGNRRSDKK